MNVEFFNEEARLRSFVSWPANTPVNPRQLAECGFYASGPFLEAECNWCHCRISNWEYGDVVERRHRIVSPQCEFITNRSCCGNVSMQLPTDGDSSQPLSSSGVVNQSSDQRNFPDLMIESNRLATFKNWPNPNISPVSLAKAGFFYLNRSDEVKCVWCKGVIAQWEKQDNAFEEHRRFFPDCPRVQLGPLIEMASDGIRDLGIQQISPPKNSKYSSLDARLRTYNNWPIPDIQKPVALAEAGLYYQEVDDQVRCFHCNMGLRSWEKEDDPWFEHAKWYPQCPFVRLVKGNTYIQQVQDLMKQSIERENQMSSVPMTIEEAMATGPVRQALEMGIDAGAIRSRTQRQLSVTGYPYATVEDLIKAVFDDRDSEDPIEYAIPALGSDCTGILSNNSRTMINGINGDIAASVSVVRGNDRLQRDSTYRLETPSRDVVISGDEKPSLKACDKFQDKSLADNKDALTAGRSSPSRLTLEEENRKLKDARLCKVCLDEEVGVVYLPCGHLVTCVQCAPGVEQCPVCRTTIKGFVRTFFS
ncbi:death-associated inhibitor of apoptosis 2 [Glossina fuscipes]|uniref:Death-associated inhibitor of apoptosis 2 n=1 Tax=Glossina fuscipes TaxID=7396 RepID=A0A9C5YU12_9MUSC|nr:death-associated inhibitor of apoptosis 2 [Glossina fuscipes]